MNVRDFGAQGDGRTDDRGAIEAALAHAPARATVFFPAGVYLIGGGVAHGVRGTGLRGVRLAGDGSRTLIKRAGSARNPDGLLCSRMFTLQDCFNLAIADLAFDLNGVEAYGGVVLQRCRGVHLERLNCTDTALVHNVENVDHCWLQLQECAEVVVADCHAENAPVVEFSGRGVSGAIVTGCTSRYSSSSSAIGAFSQGDGSPAGPAVFEDIVVQGCEIIDPRKGGLIFRQELGADHNLWRRITLADCSVKAETLAPRRRQLQFGRTNSTGAGGGNSWTDLTVERCRFEKRPNLGRDQTERFRISHSQPDLLFERVAIRDCVLVGYQADGSPAVRLEQLRSSAVTGWHLRGPVSHGLSLRRMQSTVFEGHSVEATQTAYTIADSLGDNRWTGLGIVGQPLEPYRIRGVQPTDRADPGR